ncbi:ABC transporter permease [Pseudodonghicola flavimaris]|uniref:ABC transporter permease n=1 Tax=Pseudodonghicola flavimaris TaxID=3050036 RepID=A0ABT7F6C8_9RHOB|nr:ABC transporter permease [Pseudodonghicola flavimaris]MDK3020142.1 ABC transporter permease [Pseudodonghicola flavimaris]
MSDLLLNWLINIPGFAAPFAIAALGLIITERAGVLNLAAEGFMLAGALAGVGLMIHGAPPLVALGGSVLAGMAMGLIFAIMAASFRINHVIAGLALVFFAEALTSYIASAERWTNKAISGLEPVFLGQDVIVYATPVLCALTVWMLNRTRFGLTIRAVGENPGAADAAGIDVTAIRFAAILIGAALIGLAGGYLTVAVSRIWVDSVVGGRGWIAIALVIFARWHPWRALLGAILFGCIEALIPRIAAAGFDVPRYFLQMTPYLATLAVMIWAAARGRDRWSQPAALGQHHIREERG